MVVRALASSPGSAQLLLLAKRKSGRGHGVYRIVRMVEKILIVHAWVHWPQNSKKSQGVLDNLQHVSCLAVGDRQALSI